MLVLVEVDIFLEEVEVYKVFLKVIFMLEVLFECLFEDLDYGDFVEVGYVFEDFFSEVIFM